MKRMNPPPLDMKQAQECLSMRVKTLEDMLAFDKHSWQFHEPSYAALCLAEQRISFGKFCEYMRGLRDGKTDPIVQGVTPSMELQIAERIQELEAENAALREDKARLVDLLDFESNAYIGVLVAWKGSDYVDRMLNDPAESAHFNEARAAIDAVRKAER